MLKSTRIFIIFFFVAFVSGFATDANASISISIFDPTNSGITSLGVAVTGTTIDITETWTKNAYGFLLISGLTQGVNYTVNKWITNSTGTDWVSFSNELLDPAGQENDQNDPLPYPSWVPDGYTTSNDADGLSFAQNLEGGASTIPRTSVAFSKLIVDEETDARDFLDFYDGVVAGDGGTDWPMSYGLTDKFGENDGFLLAERPNEFSTIPEPASVLLFGIGAFAFGIKARRRRKRFEA